MRLDAALSGHDQDTWVDWEDIPPTVDFMEEIFTAIRAADTFVCVLSPDSVASVVCGREVAHAVEHNKRLVPIVCRDIDAATVPPKLAALNWLFARDADDFDASVQGLLAAIATDLDWVRTHTRLTIRAAEWQSRGRDPSYLLSGADLTAAEAALVRAGEATQPQPTALQQEYVLESRRIATRNQRRLLGGVSIALTVATVLAILAWSQRNAARRATTRVEERELAVRRLNYTDLIGAADQAAERGDPAGMRAYLDNQRPGPDQQDLRGFEWYYLARRLRGGGRELFRMTDPRERAAIVLARFKYAHGPRRRQAPQVGPRRWERGDAPLGGGPDRTRLGPVTRRPVDGPGDEGRVAVRIRRRPRGPHGPSAPSFHVPAPHGGLGG